MAASGPAPVYDFAPDPARSFAFYAALASLFLRLTSLHELLRIPLYPLYIFGVPALAGLLLSGGLQRAFRERITRCWTGLCLWMALATPFSSWRSESLIIFTDYVKTVYIVVLLVAGLTLTWRDCKVTMYMLAASAVAFMIAARQFQREDSLARMSLQFGTISNANDLAAVLILLLPFLVWMVLSAPILLRVPALGGLAFGTYQVLHTASRGALVGICAACLFYFWRAPGRQKIVFAFLLPAAAALFLAVIPQSALHRLTHFFSDEGASSEAAESAETRKLLFRKSVEYTVRHPLFGVGPGEFAEYEGQHDIIAGLGRGTWHNAHNSYTQLSSECGIPALLFVVVSIVTAYRLLSRVEREARGQPECQDMRNLAFCIMLALIAFCATITFLNFAYSFHLPMLTALAAAVARAAPEEFRARRAAAEVAQRSGAAQTAGRLDRQTPRAASQAIQ